MGLFLRGGNQDEAGKLETDAIEQNSHEDAGHSHMDAGHTHIDHGHVHTDAGHSHGHPKDRSYDTLTQAVWSPPDINSVAIAGSMFYYSTDSLPVFSPPMLTYLTPKLISRLAMPRSVTLSRVVQPMRLVQST